MTSEERMIIITEMINKTRVNILQGSFPLIFPGWPLVVFSLSDWLHAKLTSLTHTCYVWFLVIRGYLFKNKADHGTL